MSNLTRSKTTVTSLNTPMWTVAGPLGEVRYSILGNHLQTAPRGQEEDSAGRAWSMKAQSAAVEGDDAMYAFLEKWYREQLAGEVSA